MVPPLLRAARSLVAFIAALLLSGPAVAQIPFMPGSGKPAAGEAAGPRIPAHASRQDQAAAELRKKLDTERRQLQVLDTPGGLAAGAPPGTDESVLRQRHLRVALIVRTLEQHLADLARLAKDKARRRALEQEMQSWTGFAEQPPYSIQLVDRLRSEQQAAETRLDGLISRADLLRQSDDTTRERIKLAEQQLRQVNEQAEKAHNGAELARINWDRDQVQLLLRAAQTLAAATAAARDALKEETDIARLEVEFARRKLEKAAPKAVFSATDLEQIRSNLAAEGDKLGREIDRLNQEQARSQTAADAARKALESARTAPRPDGNESPEARAARLKPLEWDNELQQARLDLLATQLDALRDAAEFNRLLTTQWEARFVANQNPDATSRLTLREGAEKFLAYLELQKKLLEQQTKRAEATAKEVEKRVEQAGDFMELGFLRELESIQEERAASSQRPRDVIDANIVLAQQTLAETGGAGARSLSERRNEWRVIAARAVAAVWNFELLAVEDSITVDGKAIAGTRSVTVGKAVTALLMIVAGYLLAVFLARWGERLLVRRFGWQAAQAGVVSRWLLALEFVLLMVLVLAWVKIPITVFAFLGGAIAIGLGFGMQTLLKNLMSGLMILGEKPFRLGDLVEIGGIRGTVTNIGLRASTINDVNGIDTIIPNSTFIEQNLTNWTLTTGQVRFNIRVGVAYGSPVRTVVQLLEDVAGRHGRLLKEPAPEVLFEDFGNDALVFVLYYWLDIRAGTVARVVASDLRSMVEASFGDHGIAIAFPQRDVHLDTAKPLAVRIVNEAAGPAASSRPDHGTAPSPLPFSSTVFPTTDSTP